MKNERKAPSVRESVLALLLRCEAAGQYANIALDTALSRSGLEGADRRLFTSLFYGVIEHRITLDHIIDTLSSIPPASIEARVRVILEMGLCQLLYFDRIPDHAAVGEAVSLAPRQAKGFVNALLRGFCRTGKKVPLPEEPVARLSVAYSVPKALAARLKDTFGEAECEAFLSALSTPPPVTVRVNTNRLSREEFLARFGGTPTPIAPHGVYIADTAALAELLSGGLCFVQDEASQICVEALDAHEHTVLDLCAAPGSKSFGAALSGATHVTSLDLHENKLSLIRRGANTLGLTNITVGQNDAKNADTTAALGTFPRVLCDVPCSGLGVLAKKPDIRYKSLDAVAGLPPVQRAILENAAACVKEGGGVLVYSTCTVLPEENEKVVKAFLATHPAFSLAPFAVGGLHTDGMVTLLPHKHGTDGFFVAKMQRR